MPPRAARIPSPVASQGPQRQNPDAVAHAPRAVTFRATIPVKAAAIDIHGETGARLTLEIADSDMADFLPVVLLRCKRLSVMIKEDAD